MIDISKMDKAEVLRRLYNRARPQGMGSLHYTPEDMTPEQARAIVDKAKEDKQALYLDYLKGRVMKVDLSGNSFDPWLYDRDNGQGAAASALATEAA